MCGFPMQIPFPYEIQKSMKIDFEKKKFLLVKLDFHTFLNLISHKFMHCKLTL